MKKNMLSKVLTLAAGLAFIFATTSASSCGPWPFYQPTAPKSLVKAD